MWWASAIRSAAPAPSGGRVPTSTSSSGCGRWRASRCAMGWNRALPATSRSRRSSAWSACRASPSGPSSARSRAAPDWRRPTAATIHRARAGCSSASRCQKGSTRCRLAPRAARPRRLPRPSGPAKPAATQRAPSGRRLARSLLSPHLQLSPVASPARTGRRSSAARIFSPAASRGSHTTRQGHLCHLPSPRRHARWAATWPGAADGTIRRVNRALVALLAALFAGGVAAAPVKALLPAYVESVLRQPPLLTSTLLSIQLGCGGLFALAGGAVSDHLSRRAAVLAGMTTALFGALLFVVHVPALLVAIAILWGIAGGFQSAGGQSFLIAAVSRARLGSATAVYFVSSTASGALGAYVA